MSGEREPECGLWKTAMNKNAKHDLPQYIEELISGIANDYDQVRARVLEDPGTAGDQVEETWAEVLRKWLPEHFHVVTKGRVIGSTGEASPQIDLLVLWPNYPPFLLSKKLYLASGVAAAFECKLTFRKQHLRKLFDTSKQLARITEKEHFDRKRRKQRTGQNYSYEEFHRIFEYGLLAHSFEGSDPIQFAQTISEEMERLDKALIEHPKQMVDLVCVRDLGSWVSERGAILETHIEVEGPPKRWEAKYLQFPTSGYHCLTEASWGGGSQIAENFSPLGAFLARLYRKLSRADPSMDALASFFTSTLSTGQGGGKRRVWTELTTPDDIWRYSRRFQNTSGFREEFSFLGF